MTLTEFLLSRIAEDEVEAILLAKWDDIGQDATHTLAMCEALRRIVERHTSCDDTSYGEPCDDLRDLGSIYA